MMEHILLHDWCSSKPDDDFVTEEDIDNCVIERILRNKFHNPLIYHDSDTDDDRPPIDWSEVFKKKQPREKKVYVPGILKILRHPKQSALTIQQHHSILKVLCNNNPYVLPNYPGFPKPNRHDFKAFEDLKKTYEEEKKQFIEWAKTVWTTSHCTRALRPNPIVEAVYEAEFKLRAQELKGLSPHYEMVAQIPLDFTQNNCEIVSKKLLIKVKLGLLPSVKLPDMTQVCNILSPSEVPEPCTMHPVRFILPNENAMSVLPLPEVYRELAQYACEHGAQYIASESALKCLVETDRRWHIPIAVCRVDGPDGEMRNVVVFGSEFSINRDPAQVRTYRAYRHLVESAFVSLSEKEDFLKNSDLTETVGIQKKTKKSAPPPINVIEKNDDDDLTDDEDNLVIADFGDDKVIEPNNCVNKLREVNSISDDESDALVIDETNDENVGTENNGGNINLIDASVRVERISDGSDSDEPLRRKNITSEPKSLKEFSRKDEHTENAPLLSAKKRKASEVKLLTKKAKDRRTTMSSDGSDSDEPGRQQKNPAATSVKANLTKDKDDSTPVLSAKEKIARELNLPSAEIKQTNVSKTSTSKEKVETKKDTKENKNKDFNERSDFLYKCTCHDSLFRRPPPRSFEKFQVVNRTNNEKFDFIVHCSHKYQINGNEVVLEPVAEYQADLGASSQSPEKLASMALSLHLRPQAYLMNVRVVTPSGDVIRFDKLQKDLRTADLTAQVASSIHCALSQLQGLLPGQYILQHEASHGTNALLFAARRPTAGRTSMSLDLAQVAGKDIDEAKELQAPLLTDVMLPVHKFRRTLPCAFTPFENAVDKKPKMPVKQKPQLGGAGDGNNTSKWPKKKGRKRKKNNNNKNN